MRVFDPIHGTMEKDNGTKGIPSWDGAEDTFDTFEVECYQYRDTIEYGKAVSLRSKDRPKAHREGSGGPVGPTAGLAEPE